MDILLEKKTTSPLISKICMFFSAISMGCVGLLVTFFSEYPIYTIVLLRGIFGSLFLTLFMFHTKSMNLAFLKESFKLHWKPLTIIGIINPLVIYFYFVNITLSGYAIAAFLLYTSGIFVLIMLFITNEEPVSNLNILSFILAIIGVAIIMEFWTGQITDGLFWGILSGLSLAILVFNKKKIYHYRDENGNQLQAKGDFDLFLAWWPTLFIVFLFLPLGATDLVRLTLLDIIFALILGFFPTALAFTLYNIGVKNDEGGNILILAYFEPVMAVINTVIFLGYLSIYTIIGGLFILIANIIVLKYSQ